MMDKIDKVNTLISLLEKIEKFLLGDTTLNSISLSGEYCTTLNNSNGSCTEW